MILQFNFFDYFKNPVVRFSHEFNQRKLKEPITVLTLDDCRDDINKLKHSKKALEGKKLEFIGDELRLYYSLQYDNLLYIDGDALLRNPKEINVYRNCAEYCGKGKDGIPYINNGTFFKSNKDCVFNKYYFDIYEHNDLPMLVNVDVFQKYPMKVTESGGTEYFGDMALIKPSRRHFYTSTYRKIKNMYPDVTTIKYTMDPDFNPVGIRGLVAKFINDNSSNVFQQRANGILQFFNVDDPELGTREELINLYKEQMNYTYGRELKYEEIGHCYK